MKLRSDSVKVGVSTQRIYNFDQDASNCSAHEHPAGGVDGRRSSAGRPIQQVTEELCDQRLAWQPIVNGSQCDSHSGKPVRTPSSCIGLGVDAFTYVHALAVTLYLPDAWLSKRSDDRAENQQRLRPYDNDNEPASSPGLRPCSHNIASLFLRPHAAVENSVQASMFSNCSAN